MSNKSKKLTKLAKFPFNDTTYWEQLKESISGVTEWTPDILAAELHHIKQLQKDKPLKSTPEQRYEKLLKLFKESEEFDGEKGWAWGGVPFVGRNEDFPKIVYWFMKHTLPHIAKLLVVELPRVFSEDIPLVDGLNSSHLSLSKLQCAALLAMAFFGANTAKCQPSPGDNYQELFNFDSWIANPSYSSKAKFFMLMNYFERSRIEIRGDKFEVHRLKLRKIPSLSDWESNKTVLTNFTVHNTGGITKSCGADVLQVDFANEYIGGGVLNMGAVQEEIMFSVCPELLVSLMFCSVMAEDEALVLVNAERIARWTGYNTGFKFAGDYVENCKGVCRVAIDAACYGWGLGSIEQYSDEMLLRELNKALVGFDHGYPSAEADVATGNWGCGAFGGSIQLKSMLQWCAASVAGRNVRYFTFADKNCEGLEEIVQGLSEQSVTVGKLIGSILQYCRIHRGDGGEKLGRLFDHITTVLL